MGGLPLGAALSAANPEVRFCDQTSKGYVMLNITQDRVVGELCAVSTIAAKPYELKRAKAFAVSPTGGLTEL